ncbi:hypothetical protein QOZ80_4AG0308730 [Eleusine coracana subsp. coracana]|nr:hypothetical protein QOZ80_4AG0308730 [Eleusine coracana subsp. coracana]
MAKMTTYTPNFIGATEVWPLLGGAENSGDGVVIGMIDTGIDPKNPSFVTSQPKPAPANFKGACRTGNRFPQGSCNGKIVSASWFARAGLATGEFNATIHYASPYDPDGHGSHTASIAAGNFRTPVISRGYNFGYASGIAPGASLAIYKAAYPFGGYMSDVIAAVDQAVEDGVNIITPTQGETMYSLALADDVSIDNSSDESVDCLDSSVFIKSLVQGKVIICDVTSDFMDDHYIFEIINTVQKVGAAGVIITGRQIDVDFGPAYPATFPSAVFIDEADSRQGLMRYYNNHTFRQGENGPVIAFGATVRITDGRRATYTGEAPVVATYSSRGPDVENRQLVPADALKPNVMAPGHNIWGAWSPTSLANSEFQGQDFAVLSGTSMATPHVAGLAALIKQRHPSWSPAMIMSAIMTTADVADSSGHPLMARVEGDVLEPATPFDMGTGAINAERAMDPGLVLDARFTDYLQFLCSVPGVDDAAVLRSVGAPCPAPPGRGSPPRLGSDLNAPSVTVSSLVGSRRVNRFLTSVGAQNETYTAYVRAPDGVSVRVTPSQFKIVPGDTRTLRIVLTTTAPGNAFGFGEIVLRGNKKHTVRIPLAVFPSGRRSHE